MSEESKPTDLLSGDDGGEEAVAMPPTTADPTKYSIDDEDYNKLEGEQKISLVNNMHLDTITLY